MPFIDSASMYMIFGSIIGFILGIILMKSRIRELQEEIKKQNEVNE